MWLTTGSVPESVEETNEPLSHHWVDGYLLLSHGSKIDDLRICSHWKPRQRHKTEQKQPKHGCSVSESWKEERPATSGTEDLGRVLSLKSFTRIITLYSTSDTSRSGLLYCDGSTSSGPRGTNGTWNTCSDNRPSSTSCDTRVGTRSTAKRTSREPIRDALHPELEREDQDRWCAPLLLVNHIFTDMPQP